MPAAGRNVPRFEGKAKVSGAARYIDDLVFPGMLHGRTVRSSIARGRITAIRTDLPGEGFVVADYRDIPGRNIHALIVDDQPVLAEKEVRHREEPILLLAHEDREVLLAARVEIDYEEEEPCFDPEASGGVMKEICITKGDLEQGFADAEVVVEGEYRTGHQEQLYIETNGVIAVPEDGGITVYGSLQCPFYVHEALVALLGLPPEKVRVVQAETGGGFGGKEEYPSMIAGHASILALKAGRPVKLVYDREEDMAATTKRHPSIVRHRTGLTRDGRITAMDIEVVLDAGAYTTLSPVVLSRGVLHASGAYRCDHVNIRGRAMMTHTPPNGAFRGFGAPQTLFAVEVHMERIAEELGIDPVALRERNALRPGDTTATGQVLGEDTSALQVLKEAVKRTDYHRRQEELRSKNRSLGLALFFHGSGFTGSGEVALDSEAALELTEKGARILVASTEIGQGTRTMHAQIVADALEWPYESIDVAEVDTSVVPNSGPTVASRTCMVVGRILQRCAEEMKAKVGGMSPAEYLSRNGPLTVRKRYERPAGMQWDDETYRGDAYGAYGWGCDVAEVEFDPVTYEIRPVKLTAVQEIGRAIHPVLAAGQIEGGTAQGVGFALFEKVVMEDGIMANRTMTNYIIPTTLDTPEIETVILENPYPHGPLGAKGVGEMPMDGPAPAIVNAMRKFGFDLREVPALPETIMEAACASG